MSDDHVYGNGLTLSEINGIFEHAYRAGNLRREAEKAQAAGDLLRHRNMLAALAREEAAYERYSAALDVVAAERGYQHGADHAW